MSQPIPRSRPGLTDAASVAVFPAPALFGSGGEPSAVRP